ncbi:carbohydrate-binding domain-containing protein [Pseudoroseomonas wenyumeiae]
MVLVDGVEVFRGEVTASHARGGAEIALGHVAAGADHEVVVQFLNDAWGGSEDTDRNLYVEDIRINGVSTGSTAALLDSNSDASFSITAPAVQPPAAPALCSSRARCRCRSCWVARPGKATLWRWCWWMASRSSAAR